MSFSAAEGVQFLTFIFLMFVSVDSSLFELHLFCLLLSLLSFFNLDQSLACFPAFGVPDMMC